MGNITLEMLVHTSEKLKTWWKVSGMSMEAFLKLNKAEIKKIIRDEHFHDLWWFGPLSEEAINKAFEIVREFEEQM
jgi:hypothetical protein